MNVREAMRERSKAREWFKGLRSDQRAELGDALVLGAFDFREWGFERKPSGVFLSEVDEQRILWEMETSG